MKPLSEQHLAVFRRHMVELIDIEFDVLAEEIGRETLRADIRRAFLDVPRHRFVPADVAPYAYQNRPLPIGFDKTISQPFMAALMIELLDLGEDDEVLEVGSGLGYQTAILARLAEQVYSVEIVEEFVAIAKAELRERGADNVAIKVGDGSRGWLEAAPFDAILVCAAARDVPQALARQLKVGGRLVLPVGEPGAQRLTRALKLSDTELEVEEIMAVQFTELETLF